MGRERHRDKTDIKSERREKQRQKERTNKEISETLLSNS